MASTTGFSRPTLRAIIDRVKTDINARLANTPGFVDARLRRSLNFVLANVVAAAAHSIYGFAEFIALQITVDTATGDNLERQAGVYAITRNQATFAVGNITLTGVAATAVPIGTEVQRDDGVAYTTDAGTVIGGGGSVDVAVTASVAGADGNAIAATIVEIVTPIVNVDSAGVVASGGLTLGADIETDAALLARVLARLQDPPQGGASADYIAWVLDAGLGIDRVFVNPLEFGAGTVGVRFTVPDIGAGVVPAAGVRTAAVAAIEAERPVTAIVTVPTPAVATEAVDINVTLTPNGDAALEAAVTAQLAALWLRDSVPGGTIPNSSIREAISAAAGEVSHVLNDVDGGGGLADVVLGADEVAINGALVFP